jgi:hypothetical protein
MSGKKRNFLRRDFIKTAGAAGLGSVLMPRLEKQALMSLFSHWVAY